MQRSTIRIWFLVHKWTSLICTVFLLMLCLTGLPLIFHGEIDALTGADVRLAGPPSSSNALGMKSLDDILVRVTTKRPGEVPLFMAFDNASPLITVTTGPSPDAPERLMTLHLLNRVTGNAVGKADRDGVMHFILQLHTDMFLGLPGMLFLGAMGILFVVALLSGAVLYAPFMRKLDFGTLRTTRSTRLKWLDWHNLLGITAMAWMIVVGLTGVINTLATPIFRAWQLDSLATMTRAYEGRPALAPDRYGSLDKAMASARAARPGGVPQFIAWPGGSFSSKHHYAVFLQGGTPLTERMLTPALIDAETGVLTDIRSMPWYVDALQLSQPLHFGDYGGLPLKILWALLDLFAIVVLGSGLYLWIGRRRTPLDQRLREIETGGRIVAAPVPAE